MQQLKALLKKHVPWPILRIGYMARDWTLGLPSWKKVNHRRYLRPGLNPEQFFTRLRHQRVHYAVLRWFDDLPAVAPGDDIDILVADEDIRSVSSQLVPNPGTTPCDIYSVTGGDGADYAEASYFPPRIARLILSSSVELPNGIRVPSPEHYFLSLAYHAVYHKGRNAEIPDYAEPTTDGKYAKKLRSLADENGQKLAITMDSLQQLLFTRGWQPSLDTISHLSKRNDWLQEQVSQQHITDPSVKGIATFLVREKAIELGLVDQISAQVESAGFVIVHRQKLSGQGLIDAAENIRGGNWRAGPFPVSGGGPVIAIIAWDPTPIPVTSSLKEDYPALNNARIAHAKSDIRHQTMKNVPLRRRCHLLHSSDNENQAIEYASIAVSDQLDKILQQIRKLTRDQQ